MPDLRWMLRLFVLLGVLVWVAPSAVDAQDLSPNTILDIAWSPDGERIATGHEDGTIQIWNADAGQLIHSLQGHTGEVVSLAWNLDGTQLASGDFDIHGLVSRTVRVWNTNTGQLLAVLPHVSPTSVLGIAWSLDGSQIITFGFDTNPNFKIWDATTYGLVFEADRGGDAVQIVWNADHTLVALANVVGKVIVADPITFEPITRLEESQTTSGTIGSIYSVAWSPNGSMVASGNTAGIVRLWNISTGQNLLNLQATDNAQIDWTVTAVRALCFSSDAIHLTSISSDGTLRTWNVNIGDVTGTTQLSGAPIYSAAFSPDGTQLAYGIEGGALQLIDVPTLEPIHPEWGLLARVV